MKEDGVRNSDAVVIMKHDSQVHAPTPGFLPLRLVTYLILFGVVVLWMGYPSFVHPMFVGYSILTLAIVGLVVIKRWQQFLDHAPNSLFTDSTSDSRCQG